MEEKMVRVIKQDITEENEDQINNEIVDFVTILCEKRSRANECMIKKANELGFSEEQIKYVITIAQATICTLIKHGHLAMAMGGKNG